MIEKEERVVEKGLARGGSREVGQAMDRNARSERALNGPAINRAQSAWAEFDAKPPSLDFMAQNVGIANLEDLPVFN
jgi:hypothetical protein